MSDQQTEPNTFDDFVRRFHGLATEASNYGYQSVSMLMDSDPIAQLETKDIIWRGGSMSAVGLCRWGEGILLNAKPE